MILSLKFNNFNFIYFENINFIYIDIMEPSDKKEKETEFFHPVTGEKISKR